MPVRLWPAEFERKEYLTAGERFLLRNAEKEMESGHLAVDIDPLGFATAEVRYGLAIVPEKGLLTFAVMSEPLSDEKALAYKMLADMAEKSIYERLLEARALIVRNGDRKALAFPYKHIIVFPDGSKNIDALSEESRTLLKDYVGVGFFKTIDAALQQTHKEKKKPKKSAFSGLFNVLLGGREKKDRPEANQPETSVFDGGRFPYDPAFSGMTELQCRAVFEKLVPEYMVIFREKEEVEVRDSSVAVPDDQMKITGEETELRTFFLAPAQVALVNEMGKGHRVLLANAGAGKSVVLLSKAYKYASMYKGSKVLLTCFNSNLAGAYSFRARCAGIWQHCGEGNEPRRLHLMTFHKLVKEIYNKILKKNLRGNFPDDEEVRECIEKVRSGEIQLRFKAVFIDEVQIFDPLYLELCYALFDKSEDGIFLMVGDLNQAVRKLSRRGDAPWKQMPETRLDFTGRVRYIRENYRNSQQISDYLSQMIRRMNTRFSELGMINTEEYEYDAFGKGHTRNLGISVKTGISRTNILDEVMEALSDLVENKGCAYSDIAIIFPMKHLRRKNYYFMDWVTTRFDRDQVPYSVIFSGNGTIKSSISEVKGVVLSTIDSSLGLDFRAVIVAGLYSYNYVITPDSNAPKGVSWLEPQNWTEVASYSDDQKAVFQTNVRKVFTACSRAREALYVLSDLNAGTPMEEIIKMDGADHG